MKMADRDIVGGVAVLVLAAVMGITLGWQVLSGMNVPSAKRASSGPAHLVFKTCHNQVGSTLGSDWLRCIIRRLLEEQERAISEDRTSYLPVIPHTFDPFRADPAYRDAVGFGNSDSLLDGAVEYSCGVASDASEPVRIFNWDHGGRTFRVDVLRESPPVFVVHDFPTARECNAMVSDSLSRMQRSELIGGIESDRRKSWSANLVPNFNDKTNSSTRLVKRAYAFTREVMGYDVWESEGQEPINAVMYKRPGEHYGAHCDGRCDGGKYKPGHRVATSLTYCRIASQGGHTLFTRSGLKVAPQYRQTLFFGYKLDDGHVDNGASEHAGCPVLEGDKWVATIWKRQNVTKEKSYRRFIPGELVQDFIDDSDMHELFGEP